MGRTFLCALGLYPGRIFCEVTAMPLLQQIRDNLTFFLTCVAIVLALVLLARLAERLLKTKRQVSPARRITIIAMCSAIAMVLYILDFPLLFLAPGIYKLDFSEVPVLMCGFFLGPSAGVICEAVKILLKLFLKGTTTAFVGDLANFVVGCSLVLPTTIVYHIKKSRASAIWGMVLGTACLTGFGTFFNAVYLLPTFAQLYGMKMENIIAMGTAIHQSVNSVTSFVILCVAPLNLLKGSLVSVLTLLLYKRIEKPLFRG